MKPVIEAIFEVRVTFESEDFEQISGALEALKTFELTSGELLAGPPLLAVVVYAVIANCFFTCGWVAELMLRPVFGRRTGTVGATLFRYGLAFSVGITLIPAGLSALQVLVHLGSRIF